MPVRLLVIVLMLVGSMPYRVCACAAAGTSADAPSPRPVHGDGDCGCKHRSKDSPGRTSAADAVVHGHPEQSSNAPSSPVRHDRNCPAVNPRPVVSDAVSTPHAADPSDLEASFGEWVGLSAPDRPRLLPGLQLEAGRRAVPVYLSLLSIRL